MDDKIWYLGFYNNKIENDDELSEKCWKSYTSLNELSKNVRKNDRIVFNSIFSLYDIDLVELLKLKREYNLEMTVQGMGFGCTSNLFIEIVYSVMQMIKEDSVKMKCLLESNAQ